MISFKNISFSSHFYFYFPIVPVPIRDGSFGPTNLPVLRNSLRCSGNEANISECSSTRPFFCTDSQTISVACLSEGNILYATFMLLL